MDVKQSIAKRAMDLLEDVVLNWKLSYAEGGPMTKGMEAQFHRLHGRKGLAVVNCTIGLEMVFRALSLRGRKVLVPANGMSADPLAVMNAGAIPVFGDVDMVSGTLTATEVRKAREMFPDLAAVLYIHIGCAGKTYAPVADACMDMGLLLVEDCAHVMGNRYVGTKGVASVYSMFATKVLPAGEGGIVSGEDWLLDAVKMMRMCGRPGEWEEAICQGTNGKMSELNAAFGLATLEHAEAVMDRRMAACRQYDNSGLAGRYTHPGYKYMLNVPNGDVRARLERSSAVSGKVFAVPLPDQPAFASYANSSEPLGARAFCEEHVCLKTDVDAEDAKALAAEVAGILA